MDIVFTYSHLGGSEILKMNYPQLSDEIDVIIESIRPPERIKKSKEKTKKEGQIYSPKEMNKLLKEGFLEFNWVELKRKVGIQLEGYNYPTIPSFKQCDFHKGPVLVEVQFGKYFAMYYDLFKFQYFYNNKLIKVGVEIVPCHPLKT